MRRATVIVLLIIAAACNKPAAPTPAPSTEPPSSPAPTTSASPRPTLPRIAQSAIVGAQLTLKRSASATVNVNVVEVDDNAHGSSAAPAGTRWVAVRLEISNPGGPSYSERPYKGVLLITAASVYHPVGSDPFSPALDRSVEVAQGAFVRGFVAFAVKSGEPVHAVLFTPSSGTGPDTGEWKVS